MENLKRKVLSRLSEKEDKLKIRAELLGKDEFAKEMDLNTEQMESLLNLLQDDNLLEWKSETFEDFNFRITSEGYRFLQRNKRS